METSLLDKVLNHFCSSELEFVKNIYFESKENYGQRIKNIDANTLYTNTKEHVGFGITIPDKNKLSDIVIREEILTAINNHIKEVDENICFLENCCLPLSIVLHEIGHAHDFYNRDIYNQVEIDEKKYRFKDAISYHMNIFASEYFAEKYSIQKILIINPNFELREYENDSTVIQDKLLEYRRMYNLSKELRVLSNHIVSVLINYYLIPFCLRLGAETAIQETKGNSSFFWEKYSGIGDALKTGDLKMYDKIYEIFTEEIVKYGFLIRSTAIGDILLFN